MAAASSSAQPGTPNGPPVGAAPFCAALTTVIGAAPQFAPLRGSLIQTAGPNRFEAYRAIHLLPGATTGAVMLVPSVGPKLVYEMGAAPNVASVRQQVERCLPGWHAETQRGAYVTHAFFAPLELASGRRVRVDVYERGRVRLDVGTEARR